MSVAVVTDSAASLPRPDGSVLRQLTVVPLQIAIGDRTGSEGDGISLAAVAEALTANSASVSTSRPSPGTFVEAYRRLLDSGADGIVSVHLSAGLSGTVEAARLAAREVGGRVLVVDTGSAGMGVGFPAMAAAEAALGGADLAGVEAVAKQAAAATTTLFCVESLEHLHRGGRIGAAAALLGAVLTVRPILGMGEGTVAVRDRARTTGRAMARLVELAADAAGTCPVDVAVHHLATPQRAEQLLAAVVDRMGQQIRMRYLTEVSAAVGAHVGPGLLGLVVHRIDHG